MPKARKMLSDWKAQNIQSLMKLIETQRYGNRPSHRCGVGRAESGEKRLEMLTVPHRSRDILS